MLNTSRNVDAGALITMDSMTAGLTAGVGTIFGFGLLAFAAHLAWQVARLDIGDPDLCLAIFRSDRDAGLILFAGLLADAGLRRFI